MPRSEIIHIFYRLSTIFEIFSITNYLLARYDVLFKFELCGQLKSVPKSVQFAAIIAKLLLIIELPRKNIAFSQY